MTDLDRGLAVAVTGDAGGAALRALLDALGVRVAAPGATRVTIVAADAVSQVATRGDATILALVEDEDGADRAWQAGATHLLWWPTDTRALRRTLAMAARGLAATKPIAEAPRDNLTVGDWQQDGATHSLAIVALTRFEVVNAAFGREAGDAVLQAAAQRIETVLGTAPGGRIVRRRGAEFVVVAAIDEARLREISAAITATLARPFGVGGERVRLGSRIGITQRARDEDASVALRRAGEMLTALRDGESAGTPPSAPHGTSLEALAADLHRALERGEIAVRFQPQATLAHGRIVAVEALARWEHPDHGDLGAELLLAAAQRADLGLALSEHIHEVALAQAARWPERLRGLRIALNVTAADLARGDFVERFLARIEASGVARARITAEITESGLIGDLPAAAGVLARLRGAGCRIAIDDFGTGYSSLAYLQSLPLDYLKIDRRLAQDIAGSERDRVIVRGVIAIARALGLETVAEGVETDEQRGLLADEGCTYYQGFLCAPPLDDAALIALLEG